VTESAEKQPKSTPGHGGKRPGAGRKPKKELESGPYAVLTKAKAKNETYKAQMTELEYKRQIGELLPVEEVAAAWAEQIRTARERLLSLPARVAPAVLRLNELRDVERVIRDAIHTVLDELSHADETEGRQP
jgi:hypothetical protein